MGVETKIEWATHTFNPWRGCTRVAAGCENCYAEALSKRNPGVLGVWGDDDGTWVVAAEAMWRQPVKWNRMASCVCSKESADHEHEPGCPQRARPRVFCASLCDVFEDWRGSVFRGDRRLHVPRSGGEWIDKSPEWSFTGCRPLTLDDVRSRLFGLIDATPNLDWLLLTKRPQNVRMMWPDWCNPGQRDPTGVASLNRRGNVWLGASVACQDDADRNVPYLLQCRDLCAKVFLSVEPLIEEVNLRRFFAHSLKCESYQGREKGFDESVRSCDCGRPGIDWVIVGGESGPNARPCDVAWIRSVVRQCQAAGVPCFVKQLGARPIVSSYGDWDAIQAEWPKNGVYFDCPEDGEDFPIAIVLRDPRGGDPAEWPEDLRVREVPR